MDSPRAAGWSVLASDGPVCTILHRRTVCSPGRVGPGRTDSTSPLSAPIALALPGRGNHPRATAYLQLLRLCDESGHGRLVWSKPAAVASSAALRVWLCYACGNGGA